MSAKTEISWTDASWSPWWGCTAVSPACDHCYAESFSRRLGYAEGSTKFPIWGKNAERRSFGDEHWAKPLKWNKSAGKRGRRIRAFPSMCDPMEDRRDLDQPRERWYRLIEDTPNIDWLILTKRPQNFRRFLPSEWLVNPRANVWLMATVESSEYLWRADALRFTPAVVHGLSVEPLLGPIPELRDHLDGIDWVITGGESGAKARPANPQWFRDIRDLCRANNVAYHHKQNGEWVSVSEVEEPGRHHHFEDGRTVRRVGVKSAGSTIDGQEWKQFPAVLA